MKLILFLAALPLCAQPLKFDFSHLAAKAEEKVDVTLDASTLRLATGFLSENSPDEAKAKQLAQGLRGIYVKSFTFAKEGEYTEADIEQVRAQVKGWTKVVNIAKKGETVEIYLRPDAENGGILVLAAEPKEFTVAAIDGKLKAEDIAALSGQFGIPKAVGEAAKKSGAGGKKDDD